MSKHTAGPWKSQAMSRNGYLESARVVFDSQENEICRIDYEGMPTGCEGIKRSEENAALIAAAPDLLAALEAMFDATGHLRVSSTGDPICKQARAAIAKAKGQQ